MLPSHIISIAHTQNVWQICVSCALIGIVCHGGLVSISIVIGRHTCLLLPLTLSLSLSSLFRPPFLEPLGLHSCDPAGLFIKQSRALNGALNNRKCRCKQAAGRAAAEIKLNRESKSGAARQIARIARQIAEIHGNTLLAFREYSFFRIFHVVVVHVSIFE